MLARKLAIANRNIRTDLFEVTNLPHLGKKHDGYGVPGTVSNEVAYY
ncbi:MAG: hypothetical protein ABSB61_01075 [Anaerolineales bacterium]|jgi:hypothetical protein